MSNNAKRAVAGGALHREGDDKIGYGCPNHTTPPSPLSSHLHNLMAQAKRQMDRHPAQFGRHIDVFASCWHKQRGDRHLQFNKSTGLWEILRDGRVVATAFTRLYAGALNAEIPFSGEPQYHGDPLADDCALESRG